MKKLVTRLKSIFNLKQNKMEQQTPTTPVVITSYSQPHVLQQRMKEEKLTHGQTVTGDLSPVRLESNFGKMVMYFCPMDKIQNIKNISAGDGGALPAEASLHGVDGLPFTAPANLKPGLYSLKNVQLFSNGTLQVHATEKTVFESI